jgi:hypothetical protein
MAITKSVGLAWGNSIQEKADNFVDAFKDVFDRSKHITIEESDRKLKKIAKEEFAHELSI